MGGNVHGGETGGGTDGGTGGILAIDFGTSSCAVAILQGEQRDLVEIAGVTRTPSAIFVENDGTLLFGHLADELGAQRPSRALRSLKSRLGRDEPIVLGGRTYTPVELVAALLGWLRDESTAVVGEVDQVVLTHPASWNTTRCAALARAAALAGLAEPRLEPEPVAAAAALLDGADLHLEPGELVAVYDLGAGTFDAAVAERTEHGFELVVHAGDERVGGDLFDEVLEAHVGERLGCGVWAQLRDPTDGAWADAAAQLRRSVRRAKELLSSHPFADVSLVLPGGTAPTSVRLERSEIVPVLAPLIEATVECLAGAIEGDGLDTSRLRAIHLVGGSSAIPSVLEAVQTRFRPIPCIRRADPKSVVALGAVTPLAAMTAPIVEVLEATTAKPTAEDTAASPVGRLRSARRRRLPAAAALLSVLAVVGGFTLFGANPDGPVRVDATEEEIDGSGDSPTGGAQQADSESTASGPSAAGEGGGNGDVAGGTSGEVDQPAATDGTAGATSSSTILAGPLTASPVPGPVVTPASAPFGRTPSSAAGAEPQSTDDTPVPTTGAQPATTLPPTSLPSHSVPSAPSSALVTNVWVADGDCAPIRSCRIGARLQIGSPLADGGSTVDAYRVVGTSYSAGVRQATVFDQVLTATATLDVSVLELDLPTSYIRWEIAAVNGVGGGPAIVASATVPQLVGTGGGSSYELARVSGLVAGGLTPQPGCGPEFTICAQSLTAGSVVPSGSGIGLVSPS